LQAGDSENKIQKCLFMKKYFLFPAAFLFACLGLSAQNSKKSYPEPDFIKEVYALKSDSNVLVRLEKGTSKMEAKTKFGGLGGGDNGYSLDKEKSRVRFSEGQPLTFIFRSRYDKSNDNANKMNMGRDTSMMGGDTSNMMMGNMPNMDMGSMMDDVMDPSQMISLYAMDSKKGMRKITIQASSGMNPFSKGKDKGGSTKYLLSFRKVKDGYFEIVVDKHLPRGEYSFINMGMGSMDNSSTLFAFGID
jgi:hypothetical protein